MAGSCGTSLFGILKRLRHKRPRCYATNGPGLDADLRGYETVYTYDAADELTQLVQGTSTTLFTYDLAGRPATTTLPGGIVGTVSLDTAGRLAGLSYAKSGTVVGDVTYTLDAPGHRTHVGGSLPKVTLPTAMASATYNAGNQLTNWAGTAFTYDLNGNLT